MKAPVTTPNTQASEGKCAPASAEAPALQVDSACKTFVMHLRGGAELPVLDRASLSVRTSECVALIGPSGAGKSSLLRMIYANYRCDRGTIRVRHDREYVDIGTASAREVLELRRRSLGYISQFLRVIPRVSALDIVADAGREAGLDDAESARRAGNLLDRLNLPKRLWTLPPATFSGGEQQRVNIARGLIGGHGVLLVDEPTASLDAQNRDVVIDLLTEAKQRGVAILGIFHDATARSALADREVDVTKFAAAQR